VASSTSSSGLPVGGLPRYRDLPIDDSKPARSAWGVFGDDDQTGTVNLLTPERVKLGAGLVRKGAVFSLNWSIEEPSPPISGRGELRHTILRSAVSTDDYYDGFYPQRSTQLDSLAHMAHPEHGFYNGCTHEDITGRPGSRNGVDVWARRGIAGRFVLVDLAAHRERLGAELPADESTVVTVDEVDEALANQQVELAEGDVLLLRFGWMHWYEQASPEQRSALASPPHRFAAPGLSPQERTAEWLWDQGIAMVCADSPALEAHPVDFSNVEGCLHYRIIPLLGLAVGELFALDDLAADCAADGVYEGLFTSAPINKVGGSGSPGNALAIK